jgi:hypothetical protein
MVIVQVHTGNVISVLTPSDGIDSSGSFWELESALAFSSQSAPLKNDRGRSNLASGGQSSVTVELDAHDIIGVTSLIISCNLGSILNFPTTKEFLSVVTVVENNSKSSSHVGCITL